MNCKQTIELFDRYVNGTLDSAKKKELECHLNTCEECKKQLELYRFYFSDVKIEDDFPVPAQLNAKIQYTLQQARLAKDPKKIPFWQNKRILSAATACAFLFVASILGVSNYEKLQNAAKTSVVVGTPAISSNETAKVVPEQTPEPTSAPVMARTTRQTPQISVADEPVLPQDEAAFISDTTNDIAAYSEEEHTNSVTEDTQEESSAAFNLQRTVVPAEDITLSPDIKEAILLTYPYEILSEDVYLVAVTKAELETILGYPLDTEEKDQLIIRFTTIEE